jgi:hypothetical protein
MTHFEMNTQPLLVNSNMPIAKEQTLPSSAGQFNPQLRFVLLTKKASALKKFVSPL